MRSFLMWNLVLPHQSDQLMIVSFSQRSFTIIKSPISTSVVMRNDKVVLPFRTGLRGEKKSGVQSLLQRFFLQLRHMPLLKASLELQRYAMLCCWVFSSESMNRLESASVGVNVDVAYGSLDADAAAWGAPGVGVQDVHKLGVLSGQGELVVCVLKDKRPVAAAFLHAHMDLNGMKKDADLGCERVSRGYSRDDEICGTPETSAIDYIGFYGSCPRKLLVDPSVVVSGLM
ncbi:hypothetical protein EYF80_014385 [Liparis tanakae]|uniref:Uncharacterized protein n=1 Tax=Liparis tanakae TaxID=230148 RepID=A0A4Z2IBE8_9TELE|nr:hypothetical protein EYF80_014385 [Liparis tanakae]